MGTLSVGTVTRERLRAAAPWALFGVAAVAALVLAASQKPIVRRPYSPPPARQIVVVVIDTLRADHLSCYGHARVTSPSIDAVARAGVLFEDAYANGNWTKPSIAALFTGLWPTETGALTLFVDAERPELGQSALSGSVETLAGRLSASGYRTAGFVCNPHIDGELGFGRGFEVYAQSGDCDNIVARFLEWRAGLSPDDSVFAYLHFLEPHGPYAPRVPFRSVFPPAGAHDLFDLANDQHDAWALYKNEVNDGRIVPSLMVLSGLKDLYDGEILWADDAVGRLVAAFHADGTWDDTLLVVTSDHGENFYEHGVICHPTTSFFEPQVRVPLIMRFPSSWDMPAARLSGTVQMLDVSATVAAAAGAGRFGRGRDLLGYAAAGTLAPAVVVTESNAGLALRMGALKAHVRFPEDQARIVRLYNVGRGRGEEICILVDKPYLASGTEESILRWWKFVNASRELNTASDQPGRPGDEQLRQLRALGYIGSGG